MKRFLPVALIALGSFFLLGCDADKDEHHAGDHHESSDPDSGHGDHGDHGDHGKTSKTDLAAAGIINEICPITGGDEKVDPSVTVDYKGKKVAFCCKKCVAKWNALSDAEKAAKLAH